MPGKMARSEPRPGVRVIRGAGSSQHLASVLQEGRENANVDAGLGFIWRNLGQDFFIPFGPEWERHSCRGRSACRRFRAVGAAGRAKGHGTAPDRSEL